MDLSEHRDGLEPDQIVGKRYRILKMLGRGGMGEVYEAEHIALKRRVALKVLLPHYTHNPNTLARFKREARTAASIGHPGIVEIIDLDEDEARGETFIAMELLEGEELSDRIVREGQMSPQSVARLGMDLADAVTAAHEHGIIHRDLKPQNVFLVTKGRQQDVVKVLDFGLAKLIHRDEMDASLTRSGDLLGTPLYMAPEQLRSVKDIDGRADVYSIGVILFVALTGRPPYEAESLADLILRVAIDPPPSLLAIRPELPSQLVAVVERAMAKERDERYQSAREVADALEAFAEGRPDPTLTAQRPGESPGTGPPVAGGSRRTIDDGAAAIGVSTLPSGMWNQGERPRRLVGVAIVACVLVVVAIVAGALLLTGDDHREATGPAEPGRDESRSVPVEVAAAAPAPTPVESSPGKRTVRFVSHPEGALVKLAGEDLCRAPCEAAVQDGDALVTASLEGYETLEQRVGSPWPEVVELHLIRGAPRAGPRTPPAIRRPPAKAGKAPPPLLR